MKKLIIGVGAVATAAVLATALVASAQTSSSTAPVAGQAEQQMLLQVNKSGKVLLRGTIDSVSNGVITVKSWGGDWTVNVGSSAEVLPSAVGNDITQFKTGDMIGVQGMVSQSASWTVDASVVRDWTYRTAVTAEQKQNIQSAKETRQSEKPRNYSGTVSNVSGDSFTLTVGGTSDTVSVASGAEVVNRKWATIPITSIQNNDTVHVWGVNASGTITAKIVRDVTLPATSTTQ